MSYLLMTPIPWVPFDPPPMDPKLDKREFPLCRVVAHPGVLLGPGLERMLGRELFDRVVDMGILEPIP